MHEHGKDCTPDTCESLRKQQDNDLTVALEKLKERFNSR